MIDTTVKADSFVYVIDTDMQVAANQHQVCAFKTFTPHFSEEDEGFLPPKWQKGVVSLCQAFLLGKPVQ